MTTGERRGELGQHIHTAELWTAVWADLFEGASDSFRLTAPVLWEKPSQKVRHDDRKWERVSLYRIETLERVSLYRIEKWERVSFYRIEKWERVSFYRIETLERVSLYRIEKWERVSFYRIEKWERVS